MAKITLDIGHALSRPDQHRNRLQLYLISFGLPLILSPEIARRSSQKKLDIFLLPLDSEQKVTKKTKVPKLRCLRLLLLEEA
jgi:hypothetical protein